MPSARPSSSSTVSGCTPAPGSRGSTCSTASGYDASALDWPGDGATVEEARANPDAVADVGVDEITDHYAKAIASLPARPIVIGHSFGGLIVEKLLGEGFAAAGVAIDAAPIKGVLPAPALRAAGRVPGAEEPREHRRRGVPDRRSSSTTASATP